MRELTSMPIDKTMSLALKPTSGLNLVKPCCFTSLILTVRRKYQFSPASTSRIRIFEALSHTSLTMTKVCETGGTMWAGIQMMKTAIFMADMSTTVPHLILFKVLRCSTIKLRRLMMICMSS